MRRKEAREAARTEAGVEMSFCSHPPVGLSGDHGVVSGGMCREGRGLQAS